MGTSPASACGAGKAALAQLTSPEKFVSANEIKVSAKAGRCGGASLPLGWTQPAAGTAGGEITKLPILFLVG